MRKYSILIAAFLISASTLAAPINVTVTLTDDQQFAVNFLRNQETPVLTAQNYVQREVDKLFQSKVNLLQEQRLQKASNAADATKCAAIAADLAKVETALGVKLPICGIR